jgi:hypothetical protein
MRNSGCSALWLWIFALSGCSFGQIGDPSGSAPDGIGPGAGGAAGASGAAGGAGSAAAGGTDADSDDPGRVTLHRLNRAEYNNTVAQLLGTALRPADDFPADDHSYGFDNIADALTLSPTQLELYERAADQLVAEVLDAPLGALYRQQVEAETLGGGTAGNTFNLSSAGDLVATFTVPRDGDYTLSVRMWGQQAGPEPVKVELRSGVTLVRALDVTATDANPLLHEELLTLAAGTQNFTVSFVNDFYVAETGEDRNLLIDYFVLEGPEGQAGQTNPIRDRVYTCDLAVDEAGCLRQMLRGFADRAYRRPASEAELDRLVALTEVARDEGDTLDAGIGLALKAVLLSPHFLFRVELDAAPQDLTPHALDPFELASRLSYFLWSSMPDDLLLAAARDGSLSDPAVLRTQAERLLDDPRARALEDNFAGQWLFTRALRDVQPDYDAYPAFDEALRDAMAEETRLFFRELLVTGAPISDLMRADFSFVNARLAAHYGLPAPADSGFERVAGGEQRGGILTHGSVLTVTSNPARTSVVKRGKWVLGQLLCDEPPPPPPNVDTLPEADELMEATTLRERLEFHRENPVCASCHRILDPIGFGLERFDGIGAWRDLDNGLPVDASGLLPDGTTFNGPLELAQILADDARLSSCVAEKLFVYGLGRGVAKSDLPYLDAVVEAAGGNAGSMRDVLLGIVTSDPFRMRRGEEVAP